MTLNSYFLTPFWTKNTKVVPCVPKFVPVIVIVDLRIGEDEFLDRDVTVKARAGLYENVNVDCWSL